MITRTPQHLAPPRLERLAPAPAGAVFWFWGRALKIIRAHGEDAAAPVIVEEIEASGQGLPGQLSLWGLQGVRRLLAEQGSKP